ncbi:TetR/AcrR family transcriptional regulator [Streptosporangium sp. KLBMP 9127]|nr:TetR family transcriptional regulator [Streptosporangium sp. KLBMP 9127]
MNLLLRLAATDSTEDAPANRILDAALAGFLDTGLRRTTMEEVARRAGVSRITVYRRFPRRDDLVEAVIMRELRGFLAAFDAVVSPLPTLEEQLVEGFVVTLRHVRGHPLLTRVLADEPDLLLPYLTVGAGPGLDLATDFLIERAARFGVPAEEAAPVAETCVRLALSFVLTPGGRVPLGEEEQARRFARSCLVPLLRRS